MADSQSLPIEVGTRGPAQARIALVGEAPGEEEVGKVPFIGKSGWELEGVWVPSAGLIMDELFVTNAIRARPPNNDIKVWFATSERAAKLKGFVRFKDRWCHPDIVGHVQLMERELRTCAPRVVVALGGTALWALTGMTNGKGGPPPITSWRGSLLEWEGVRVIPTLHPAAILRTPEWRHTAICDLKRARREAWRPDSYVWTPPTLRVLDGFELALYALRDLKELLDRAPAPVPMAWDVETTGAQIDCIGWSAGPGIASCLPLFGSMGSLWDVDQEMQLIALLRDILRHPRNHIIGHNWLYDMQYIARAWGICAWPGDDTMVMEHVWNPRGGKDDKGISKAKAPTSPPKSLGYLSSIYSDHYVWWKHEIKGGDSMQRWRYNAKDCIATLEVWHGVKALLRRSNLWNQYVEKRGEIEPAFYMCLRGFAVDEQARKEDRVGLKLGRREAGRWLNTVLGCKFNPSSNPHVHCLLYEVFKLPKQMKGRRVTADKDAIDALLDRVDTPNHVRPVLEALADYRSMGTLLNTFAKAPLDTDGRWRCSINLGGTESLRWSSSTDCFGFGGNMQNLTSGD